MNLLSLQFMDLEAWQTSKAQHKKPFLLSHKSFVSLNILHRDSPFTLAIPIGQPIYDEFNHHDRVQLNINLDTIVQ